MGKLKTDQRNDFTKQLSMRIITTILFLLFISLDISSQTKKKFPGDSVHLNATIDADVFHDYEKALSGYEKAKELGLSPLEKVRIDGFVGLCYYNMKKYAEAIKYFTIFLSSIEKNKTVYNAKSDAFYYECLIANSTSRVILNDDVSSLKYVDKAILELNETIKTKQKINEVLYKRLGEAYYLRASIKFAISDTDKTACDDLRKAGDYGSESSFKMLADKCK